MVKLFGEAKDNPYTRLQRAHDQADLAAKRALDLGEDIDALLAEGGEANLGAAMEQEANLTRLENVERPSLARLVSALEIEAAEFAKSEKAYREEKAWKSVAAKFVKYKKVAEEIESAATTFADKIQEATNLAVDIWAQAPVKNLAQLRDTALSPVRLEAAARKTLYKLGHSWASPNSKGDDKHPDVTEAAARAERAIMAAREPVEFSSAG